MPHQDNLALAIRTALAHTPKRPRDLRNVAEDALALIEETRATLPMFEVLGSERNNVSLALLLASMDQARSLCYLLSKDPGNNWYAALILHRSQIDHFLRGAFFAKSASDNELDYFLRKNQLPSRTPKGNPKRPLSINELTEIVIQSYGWNGERLQAAIRNNWGPLSGIVHGGRELLNAYISEEGIGAEIELFELVDIVTNSVSLAHMVIAVMMTLSSLTIEDQQPIVGNVHRSFRSFVRAHKD